MSTTNPLTPYMIDTQKIVLAAIARRRDNAEAVQQLADLLCTPAANHDLAHADDECAVLEVELTAMRSKWQIALEAGNEAVKELEATKVLQSQLVGTLRAVHDEVRLFHPHHSADSWLPEQFVQRLAATLTAAGAA